MSTNFEKVKDIFQQAVEEHPPEQWESYLNAACGGDADLCRNVKLLLHAHAQGGSLLDHAPLAVEMTSVLPSFTEKPGAQIGPYKLLEQIGEGGMGVVFMAEQIHPVQRRVALKIIKPGMDTRQVIARFEAERQALAMMDHPNISRVLDAGATESGRPYFVMELVRGVPLTDFCDQSRLSIRQRLELFTAVCRAVQHAHQKGIIHRDLKPTNVLVTQHDGRPMAKVIDFGVAKATGQKLTDKTLFTGFAQMIGTPLYMSPEQAEMSELDVDTRSDIFSLGVLLYELLTGTTPFESERLKSASFDELRRIIREEEPPRPSTRLTTLAGQAISTVCTQRQSDPRQLSRLLHGELDWIVMKCLEKDRTRRYETASALALDVEHYLQDQPVEACPPSTVYRVRKFARRNRGAVLAATLIAGALLAGIAGSTWQAVRATKAERQASAERDDKEQARRDAVASAQRAEEVSKFLVSAFRSPDPERDGREITIAEVLDRSAKELPDKFADDPVTKAALLQAIGESYDGLGLRREEIVVLEQARALRSSALGPDHPDTLNSMSLLAWAYDHIGRQKEAIALAEEMVQRATANLGHEHAATLESMNRLAWLYDLDGRTDEAITLAQQIVSVRRAKLGPDDPETLRSSHVLATFYSDVGRCDDAIALHEETLRALKVNLGLDHSDTLWSMNNLAIAYGAAGRWKEAVQLHEETLKLRTAKFGPDEDLTIISRTNLAVAYMNAGRNDEAIALNEETLKLMKAKLEPRVLNEVGLMSNLATAYMNAGRKDEALQLGEESVNVAKAKLGPDHPTTLRAMQALATDYSKVGRMAESLPLREEALKLFKAKLGPDHPDTLGAMADLATDYSKVGRMAESLPLSEEAFRLCKTRLGPDHATTLLVMGNLGEDYINAGRTDDGLRILKDLVELRKKKLEPDHPDTLMTMTALGHQLWQHGKYAEAEATYREAIRAKPDFSPALNALASLVVYCPENKFRNAPEGLELAQKCVKLQPESSEAWQILGLAQYRTGAWQASIDALEKSCALQKDPAGGDAGQWLCLAMAHYQLGNKEEARRWYDKSVQSMDKNATQDEGFASFRREAEALLKTGETTKPIEKDEGGTAIRTSDTKAERQ